MFPLIETVVAFAVIMLATSLFVSALVQILVQVGRYRSRTLVEMLRALIHGFRVFHNDPDVVDPDTGRELTDDMARRTACEMKFVEDVLSDPVLHVRGEKLAYQDDPEKLSKLIDYIDTDDLVAIAYNTSKARMARAERSMVEATSEPTHVRTVEVAETDVPLPDRWVDRDPEDPARKAYATTANFAAYVGRWFTTVEATATERFKRRVRQLSLLVALMVVLAFNLDGIQLAGTLYTSGNARRALATQVGALETSETRLGIAGAPEPTGSPSDRRATTFGELGLELQKTATIVDEAGVGIGWQNSWITRRWCAYTGQCAVEMSPPATLQVVRDTAFWLVGLMFSCVMLSLGTPFWGRVLARFVRVKNEVQYSKARQPRRFKEEAMAMAAERSRAEERGRISSKRGRQIQS